MIRVWIGAGRSKDIKVYLDQRNPKLFLKLIDEKNKDIDEEIKRLKDIKQMIKRLKDYTKEAMDSGEDICLFRIVLQTFYHLFNIDRKSVV